MFFHFFLKACLKFCAIAAILLLELLLYLHFHPIYRLNAKLIKLCASLPFPPLSIESYKDVIS